MKTYLKISVLTFSIFLLGCQNSQQQTDNVDLQPSQTQQPADDSTQNIPDQPQPAQTQDDQLEKSSLVVHGMGCPLCAYNVRKKLYEIDGIKDIKPDLNTGNVVIYYEKGNRPTDQQLEQAIQQSGFTLKEIID